jgi:hypothetical protein
LRASLRPCCRYRRPKGKVGVFPIFWAETGVVAAILLALP